MRIVEEERGRRSECAYLLRLLLLLLPPLLAEEKGRNEESFVLKRVREKEEKGIKAGNNEVFRELPAKGVTFSFVVAFLFSSSLSIPFLGSAVCKAASGVRSMRRLRRRRR